MVRDTLMNMNKLTYRSLQATLNCQGLTEAQLDLPITCCGTDGNLYQVNGDLGVQTTDNGSTVIDPTTPILFLEQVG